MKALQLMNQNVTKDELYNARYTTKDFNGQFTEIREREPVELYANLMYLSNQLAHAFGENRNLTGKNKQSALQMSFIRESLMNIKDWCVHKIISEKEKGASVELATKNKHPNSKFGLIFVTSLPNYFEPFIVHISQNELSEKEKQQCSDNYYLLWNDALRTTFPSYISEGKAKLFEKVYYKNYFKYENIKGSEWNRLSLFLSRRNRLLKRKSIKGARTTGNMKSKSDKLDIQKDNILVLEELERILKIKFPCYFKNGLLQRTSYSLRDVQSLIYETAREKLKKVGIREEDMDGELAKLFIHMKMTEPLSTFIRSEENRENVVNRAIEGYDRCFSFIIANIEKTNNYSELKSKMRKFARQDEEPESSVLFSQDGKTNVGLVDEIRELTEQVLALTSELEDLKIKLVDKEKLLDKSQKRNKKLLGDNKKLRRENERLKKMSTSSGGVQLETSIQIGKTAISREGDENEK